MDKHKINNLSLLKLDIEGSEIDVLEKMLHDKIFPTQICVEFDGLNWPSKKARNDFQKIDEQLRASGYLCYNFDGHADFLYVLRDEISKAEHSIVTHQSGK